MTTRRPTLDQVNGQPIFVTVSEAAGLLRLGPNTVRELVSQGELGPRKYPGKGKRYLLYYTAVRAWADSLPEEPPDA